VAVHFYVCNILTMGLRLIELDCLFSDVQPVLLAIKYRNECGLLKSDDISLVVIRGIRITKCKYIPKLPAHLQPLHGMTWGDRLAEHAFIVPQ
jgi:hypothetical protein